MSILNTINQLSIFDIEDMKEEKVRFERDDKVIINFYIDEIEQVRIHFLYLMGVGILEKKKNDFWLVNFDGKYEYIEENRLKIHSWPSGFSFILKYKILL